MLYKEVVLKFFLSRCQGNHKSIFKKNSMRIGENLVKTSSTLIRFSLSQFLDFKDWKFVRTEK